MTFEGNIDVEKGTDALAGVAIDGREEFALPASIFVGVEVTRLKSTHRLLTSSPAPRIQADELHSIKEVWNLLAILNSSSALTELFTWGLDLSGSMQGAGGVGGLLWLTQPGGQGAFIAFDGNGNVSALVNSADGTSLAQYEYGPFGEVIRATGPMAKANPFRFSTKYQDDESDMAYYGYRYYGASTGRFLSRDTVGEDGFELLRAHPPTPYAGVSGRYLFVNNDPNDLYDPDGLSPGGVGLCAVGIVALPVEAPAGAIIVGTVVVGGVLYYSWQLCKDI